jgi:hypothetical protein
MEQEVKTETPEAGTGAGAAADRGVADELRELGASLAALGRTAFRGGRVLSAELLRSARGIVDRAREEIERLSERK